MPTPAPTPAPTGFPTVTPTDAPTPSPTQPGFGKDGYYALHGQPCPVNHDISDPKGELCGKAAGRIQFFDIAASMTTKSLLDPAGCFHWVFDAADSPEQNNPTSNLDGLYYGGTSRDWDNLYPNRMQYYAICYNPDHNKTETPTVSPTLTPTPYPPTEAPSTAPPTPDPCTWCFNAGNDGACIANPRYNGVCTNPAGSALCKSQNGSTGVTACEAPTESPTQSPTIAPTPDPCGWCFNPKDDGACIASWRYNGVCTNPGASSMCTNGQGGPNNVTACEAPAESPNKSTASPNKSAGSLNT
jgi:hypothetical protein